MSRKPTGPGTSAYVCNMCRHTCMCFFAAGGGVGAATEVKDSGAV